LQVNSVLSDGYNYWSGNLSLDVIGQMGTVPLILSVTKKSANNQYTYSWAKNIYKEDLASASYNGMRGWCMDDSFFVFDVSGDSVTTGNFYTAGRYYSTLSQAFNAGSEIYAFASGSGSYGGLDTSKSVSIIAGVSNLTLTITSASVGNGGSISVTNYSGVSGTTATIGTLIVHNAVRTSSVTLTGISSVGTVKMRYKGSGTNMYQVDMSTTASLPSNAYYVNEYGNETANYYYYSSGSYYQAS